ncbi:MAG: hypothetical protein OXG19_00820, partial [Chloroflexi bacterium]|nr:hypothetical protein [Chloroflexota bacterium]
AWMTYAFTGCSGTIPAGTAGRVSVGELPALGGTSLTAPIRHGPYHLLPNGWTGPREGWQYRDAPGFNDGRGNTEDINEARRLPYWRDPVLPAGWTFGAASNSPEGKTIWGYEAVYLEPNGSLGLEIIGQFAGDHGLPWDASWQPNTSDQIVREARMIAGRPAIVKYSPSGPQHQPLAVVRVHIYDAATESQYELSGLSSLRGDNVDPMIAIAESLFAEERTP